jgi:dihydrofolate synthase/folylpolyglutamate synthase
MPSQADWIESLTPWPEEFGLDRMRALLARLGEPQRAYPSIHVVGTNGKSTAVRTIEELLAAEGLGVGAYLSPHVRGWSERIRVRGEEADFERTIERIRGAAEELGATQFEALTAAALTKFRDAGVDVAVVEAGLGGRLDATNVLGAGVVLLTNVSLEHTEVLGSTREEIAREKLAVAEREATVVLGEPEWARLVPGRRVIDGGAREAAEAFIGHAVDTAPVVELAGRWEVRGEEPLEIWDGAHNPAGVVYLARRAAGREWVLVASVLEDKDIGAMLRTLSDLGNTFVATTSSNPRALSPADLARAAARYFEHVEPFDDASEAVARGRELAGPDGAILVTGSLYLLADVSVRLQGVP